MRFFLFGYTWSDEAKFGWGNLWFESKTFPSLVALKDLAKERCPDNAALVITGWDEFKSKKDYLDFIEE